MKTARPGRQRIAAGPRDPRHRGHRQPGFDLRLIAADDEEPARSRASATNRPPWCELNAVSLADARAVFLAGSPESSRKALDAEPASARSSTSPASPKSVPTRACARRWWKRTTNEAPAGGTIHVIAHPAAIALALFLRRLQRHDPIRRSVIQIFAPASEHGMPGVEELQQQTVSLLSFKSLPQGRLRCAAQLQPAGQVRRGGARSAGGSGTAHRAAPGHAAGAAGRRRRRAACPRCG